MYVCDLYVIGGGVASGMDVTEEGGLAGSPSLMRCVGGSFSRAYLKYCTPDSKICWSSSP